MASNEYNDMTELIKEYYDVPVGTYLNQSISINSVTLACDIYRVEPETVLTSSVFTGCAAVDANTQIVIGRNMSVASGTTLTPPYRCKGIVIGDVGTFTNEGTISMTARGASGAGKNIQLTTDYMISATGGTGGVSKVCSSSGSANGNSGNSPSSGVLSCAGGGSGGTYAWTTNITVTSGAGGTGTSFSGGAGGGGITSVATKTASNGSSSGGAGGNAKMYFDNKEDKVTSLSPVTGGTGNSNGVNYVDTTYFTITSSGGGTGGLLVIIANTIIQSGSLTSKGSQADYMTYTPPSGKSLSGQHSATGGSSGGGCIVLISKSRTTTGTNSVAGGAAPTGADGNGGAGGAGVYASYIVEDLILQNLPVEIAISDTNHLDNIEPSEGVRLLGMMDDDELYYEIMGTRHSSGSGHILEDEEGTTLTKRKALVVNSPLTVEDDSVNEKTDLGVDTDVDLSVIHAPGTAHNATDGSPVGTIISFFGYTAPSGYLVCDGTEYAKADYPYLATHLADLDDHYSTTQYVGSDSDHFKVPDLRGEFLRGSGTNSHENNGNGANVGVHQDSTYIKAVATGGSHEFWIATNNTDQTIVTNPDKQIMGTMGVDYYNRNAHNDNISTIEKQSLRPTNTSVLYCIKYN